MGARPTIVAVAGEPSGDQHTAMLGRALLERADVDLVGVGQEAMGAAGFNLLFDSSQWGGIGLHESLLRCPMLVRKGRSLVRWVARNRPDLLVLVDFGAFNVRIARMVKRRVNVPILYYFPPRSWNRAASGYWRLAGVVDRWATPFTWSAEILQSEGLNATWVGHPVVDRIQPVEDRAALRAELGLSPRGPVLGLLPGSRCYEVRANCPPMLGAARLLGKQLPDLQVLLSVAPSMTRERLQAHVERAGTPGVRLMEGSPEIARVADLVMVSAGTATLDLAAAGCPTIVVYRGTLLMRLEDVFRRMGRRMIALPNIIADRRIVPEVTGWQATPANLSRIALELMSDAEALDGMRQELLEVRGMLGAPDVSGRVAEIALDMVAAEG